jgi:leader peptidase (prepilin peptidase)/N-methyltransferase
MLGGSRVLAALIGLCALFGLAIGSFLNVVIYRVPRHESIVSPRSACPSCGAPILERDNVPVISWLVLRGHCRSCHARISIRYPLVELTCAGLFAGTAARFGFNWELPAFLALMAGLLALACIDAELLILPKLVVYPSLGIVGALLLLAAAATGEWHPLLIAVICSVAWFVTFFLLNAASPRVLGFGDVRLALLLGLGLGWLGVGYVLLGFFIANLVGAAVGITLMAVGRMERHQQIPYGVFLSVGTAAAVFAGPQLLAPFHHLHFS